MAATLPNIPVGDSWVDINTQSTISVGTAMEIINKGGGDVVLVESSSEPSPSSLDGIPLTTTNAPYAIANIKTGSLKIWAKASGKLGSVINVQEVT